MDLPVPANHRKEPFAPEVLWHQQSYQRVLSALFCGQLGIHYTALRYANIFAHAILFRVSMSSRCLPSVCCRIASHHSLDGEQAKDYLYVDDAVNANILALDHGDDQAYNIGSGKPFR